MCWMAVSPASRKPTMAGSPRYADDITFSTSRKFPPEIAVPTAGAAWQVSDELVCKSGTPVSRSTTRKRRTQFRGSRQVTTGLMVNEKVNIRQEYFRAARHMCKALFTTGNYYRMVPATLAGRNRRSADQGGDHQPKSPWRHARAYLPGQEHRRLRVDDMKKAKPTRRVVLFSVPVFRKLRRAHDAAHVQEERPTRSICVPPSNP